jgi:glycosyltransferase involved in cell wall biosynthesis
MQRINILYVVTKLELGGAQKQLLSLLKGLDCKQFKPFLFTAGEGFLIPEAQAISGLTLKKSRYLKRAINPFRDFLVLIELYQFIRKNTIVIVHTHSSKAGILGRLAAKLAKVVVIIHTVHGWSFNDYQSKPRRLLFLWLERFAASFTDKLIAVSAYDIQKGLSSRIGQKEKYKFIRYGIDYVEFKKKDLKIREELGIKSEDLVVGMVSCFKPQKSPHDFIRLACLTKSAMPNIKFLLVGDGYLRKSLEKSIRRSNMQGEIIMTGWRKDIHAVLSAIDVFVLTSLWEGVPIAVLESMLASLPVVVTNTGGIAEVIRDGESGFLVLPRDMQKMSDRVILLLKDKPLRLRMGQKAAKILDGAFTISNMVRESENLYDMLMMDKEGRYAA